MPIVLQKNEKSTPEKRQNVHQKKERKAKVQNENIVQFFNNFMFTIRGLA